MSLCNLIAGVLVMGVVVPGVGLARKNREAHGLWVAERSSLNRSEIRQVVGGVFARVRVVRACTSRAAFALSASNDTTRR
jgi:hypothetical protein